MRSDMEDRISAIYRKFSTLFVAIKKGAEEIKEAEGAANNRKRKREREKKRNKEVRKKRLEEEKVNEVENKMKRE